MLAIYLQTSTTLGRPSPDTFESKAMMAIPSPCAIHQSSSCSSTHAKAALCGGGKSSRNSRPLGADFVPGDFDVICSRTAKAWNHSGNKFFRGLVKEASVAYSDNTTKTERIRIVTQIIETVRSKGTGFVKLQQNQNDNNNNNEGGGEWMEIGDILARQKVGEMLRNVLSSKYRSSIQSKKQRRRNVQAKRTGNIHKLMESNKSVHKSMTIIKQGASSKTGLSDGDLLAFFVQQQSCMLQSMKSDKSFVDRFHQEEMMSRLILNED